MNNDLISRSALIPNGVFYANAGDPLTSLDELIKRICSIPAVDAVEVVRCKDCENGKRCIDGYVQCSHPSGKRILMKSFDFCSYGERRADG